MDAIQSKGLYFDPPSVNVTSILLDRKKKKEIVVQGTPRGGRGSLVPQKQNEVLRKPTFLQFKNVIRNGVIVLLQARWMGMCDFGGSSGDASDAFSGDLMYRCHAIAIFPNAEQVVTGELDGDVQLWETQTGNQRALCKGHIRVVNKVMFSPCGLRVVSSGSDKTVRLWCAQTGACLQVFEGHTGYVLGVAFSPCGQQIASASTDKTIPPKTIRTWDIQTAELRAVMEGHSGRIFEQLAIMELDEEVDQVMYSPGGLEFITFAMSDGILRCWNPHSGEGVAGHETVDSNIVCCCLSPDGKLVAKSGRDGILRLWKRSSGVFVEGFPTMIGLALDIQWSRGSEYKFLVTTGMGWVRVWQLIEKQDEYSVQLLWGVGKKELSLLDANLTGVVGLSPVDMQF
ncbi:MAG: WD40-repeat-containing domain protein [Linnemannia gamsii]|nr:MAG: WD40-repeat-containing domain protein [Linnemannia gamsii]